MAVLGWEVGSILLLGDGSPVGEHMYQLTSGIIGSATLRPSDRLAVSTKMERFVLETCKGLVTWSVVASHDSVVPAEPGDEPRITLSSPLLTAEGPDFPMHTASFVGGFILPFLFMCTLLDVMSVHLLAEFQRLAS